MGKSKADIADFKLLDHKPALEFSDVQRENALCYCFLYEKERLKVVVNEKLYESVRVTIQICGRLQRNGSL